MADHRVDETEPAPDHVPDPVDVVADLHRLTTPTAVERTEAVTLGGVPQVVSVRGRRRDAPVLVMVHGGPGAPLSGTSWMWQRPVEEYFTVVHYDQRAAGRSFGLTAAEAVRPTMSIEQYTRDARELVEWTCAELGVERVLLAGHSWGSAVAVRAVLARPELVGGYLGIGQVVCMQEGERESWRWARAEAQRRGNAEGIAALEALQPYPGDAEGFFDKVVAEREWVGRFGGFAAGRDNCDYYGTGDVLAPGWSDTDRASSHAGNEMTARQMLPQLLDLDLRDVTEFPVPMVQFLGRSDYMTPTAPVLDWLSGLTVPSLAVEWFEDSGHMAMYEEPGHFLLALLEHLLPLASQG